jgi:Spx/MgsR family transcriptional regulator
VPTLFGIKNCDTVKKARRWLDEKQIAYQFHDFKTDGLTLEQLQEFAQHLGWQHLINRSSTSWRQLSPEQQAELLRLQNTETASADKAMQILLQTPTLLKRPILNVDNQWLIGFKPDIYNQQLLKTA